MVRVNWNRLAGLPAGFADGVDDGPTYSANAPVTLSGTEIGLRSAGCPAGSVWKWGGTGWSCQTDIDTNSGGDITGVPPAADCNEAAEAGRLKFETAFARA